MRDFLLGVSVGMTIALVMGYWHRIVRAVKSLSED
jgi:uncharacterized membrane protein